MISKLTAILDERDAAQIVQQILKRRWGYTPQWEPGDKSEGAAIVWIFARYLQAIIERLNRAPEKNKLAFLDMLGINLVTAQSARAAVVFQLAPQALDTRAGGGTQVAAPPPPGRTEQVVFETEQTTGIAAASLMEIFSLWPGRDQYINHSGAFLSSAPLQLFKMSLLQPTPHAIYIAHHELLALAGKSTVDVEFDLTQRSSEPLDILWEYWDGQVWRGFKAMRPACMEKAEEKQDTTKGLTSNGQFVLETDCAETAKTRVNGIENFWIRGRLTQPLPPDPAKLLPEVESVRLGTTIEQPLKLSWKPAVQYDRTSSRTPTIHGVVINEGGQPLKGIPLELSIPDDPGFGRLVTTTRRRGAYNYPLSLVTPGTTYKLRGSFFRLESSVEQKYEDPTKNLRIDLTLKIAGLMPDKAFADGTAVDLSKPFHPFGQQPQPGSTFYFSQEEVFSKPGAKVQIAVIRTATPQDQVKLTGSDSKLPHTLSWEYWNGEQWNSIALGSDAVKPGLDLDTTEIINLTVPPDMARTKVNDQDGFWMRVRLVGGSYGFTRTVVFNTASRRPNQFTYVIPQPPSLAGFFLGYTWLHGLFPPEQVLTHNDFRYEDHTDDARWPGRTFSPFKRVTDVTPALYLGFDKKLPVDRFGLYFDIVEERNETEGPAMLWEYWNGSEWRSLSAEDETRNLRLPGILSFIAAEDSRPMARFGMERQWLRGRLKEDGPPGEPTVNAVFPNAVWASQWRTFNDVALGASSGLPNQVFIFTQFPVLDGERIEVRELAGRRANVEWRILAMEIAKGNRKIITVLEEKLGREGGSDEIVEGNLRLVREQNKRVAEVWVRWENHKHLFFSGPEDRHYVIDRALGRLYFGDGDQGKIPPAGAAVIAKQYRAGGGLFGNVAARKVSQLLGNVPGIQAVFNPRAAEGGADGETLENFSTRGPQTVRHRGRAVSAPDYETLAHEASPAVAVARAIPTHNGSGRSLPGWVTLLLIPASDEARPWPSFGLRQKVRRFIEEHAPADLVEADHIYITGPDYLAVDVEATLAPVELSKAGEVETRARHALQEFLHPLRGGPEGRGWELGRGVFLSDLAAVLERVEGVDYVEELALLVRGARQGEQVEVAADRVVAAGEIRLKLKAAER